MREYLIFQLCLLILAEIIDPRRRPLNLSAFISAYIQDSNDIPKATPTCVVSMQQLGGTRVNTLRHRGKW